MIIALTSNKCHHICIDLKIPSIFQRNVLCNTSMSMHKFVDSICVDYISSCASTGWYCKTRNDA